jgi:hypothetical protein
VQRRQLNQVKPTARAPCAQDASGAPEVRRVTGGGGSVWPLVTPAGPKRDQSFVFDATIEKYRPRYARRVKTYFQIFRFFVASFSEIWIYNSSAPAHLQRCPSPFSSSCSLRICSASYLRSSFPARRFLLGARLRSVCILPRSHVRVSQA